MRDPDDFNRFVAAVGLPAFSYKESLSNAVRVNYSERVFTANEAPPEVEIYLHHEMAQTPVSPSVLFFCCISAAEHGGATPVCRSDQLFEAFKLSHPKWTAQLLAKGLRYVTRMPAVSDGSSGHCWPPARAASAHLRTAILTPRRSPRWTRVPALLSSAPLS